MIWKKKGKIFTNDSSKKWSYQYAGIPTVDIINQETLRIYYYSMDRNMDGRISYFDVSAQDPSNILFDKKEFILDIGEKGTFDDCGVCPSTILSIGEKKYLYYLGVQRAEKVPYLYFAGVCQILNNDKLIRLNQIPVLDRTKIEPFTRSATTIIKDKNSYLMIYVSAFSWFNWNGKLCPKYILRSIRSKDGLTWNGESEKVIEFENKSEFGFGRPWILKENNIYKLYYSIRSIDEPYKMGYAESTDFKNWVRKDHLINIQRSESGWDSEMICYPCVVNTKYGKYMFYNGNQHGKSGIGYAKLEQ